MTTNGLGKLKILYLMSLALVWLAIYKQSGKIALKTSVNDLDAIKYAKAYKQALEYKKHGRKILLPAHLLADVPEKFQSLVSSQ